jgi:hypothetical protein
MIILLNIPTAAHVIELAKFHSRDGCFSAGNIQFISYIIQLSYTASFFEEFLQITTSIRTQAYHTWIYSDLEHGLE